MTKVDRVGTKPSVSAITIIGIIAGGHFLQSHAAKLALAGNKSKRSLLTYPPESVFQVTLGVSIEGDFERNVAGFGLALQHNSHLPGDGQIILPELVSSRMSSVYDQLSTIFQRYGFDGFECLKKMICQIGETPLEGGLLEEIITFVLTPSQHRVTINNNNTASIMINSVEENESLLLSETLGKQGANCSLSFPKCADTPLDLISYIEYL
ncbi:hypothetical protein RUM44_005810 [Polyplax serrata]|uniref:Uncharacterized protein n=1 Tax=Polyplax serrata TaxID=468196 RepID=A0ABR1AY48_POLSC